ncbi:hypothetical protein R1flu_000251 [Riccia fluitans]|uniref:Uncharacterized protein n=1 Tax=Riccia fluitans TaxID=41844 RepID=A0ABD1XZX8_9MARC
MKLPVRESHEGRTDWCLQVEGNDEEESYDSPVYARNGELLSATLPTTASNSRSGLTSSSNFQFAGRSVAPFCS